MIGAPELEVNAADTIFCDCATVVAVAVAAPDTAVFIPPPTVAATPPPPLALFGVVVIVLFAYKMFYLILKDTKHTICKQKCIYKYNEKGLQFRKTTYNSYPEPT